jgi:hypothetical protein
LFFLVLLTQLSLFAENSTAKKDSKKENNQKVEKSLLSKKQKASSEERQGSSSAESENESTKPKVDLFDPPEFKNTSTPIDKTLTTLKTKAQLQANVLPAISLKATVIKSNGAMAILLIDKKEILVEPKDVFPVVTDKFKWELTVNKITKNGVEIEINYNSIKLLVK